MKKQSTWAVVPIKDLSQAKQRLADVLRPEQRRDLFQHMVQDVFNALTRATDLSGVIVVSRDPWACEYAAKASFELLRESENRGQTAAIHLAAKRLTEQGVGTMMTVPGDVPLITAQEINRLIAEHGLSPAVTIAPALDELGSNAVLCSPPDVMALRFGDNSFFPHLQKACDLGITPKIVKQPGFALDIDRPADLIAFVEQTSGTHAFKYLKNTGLRDWILRTNPAITKAD